MRQYRQDLREQWNEALLLYSNLRNGQLLGGDKTLRWLQPGEVLCAQGWFDVGRFRSAHVSYSVPGYAAVGSPGFVAGAALTHAVSAAATRRQAARRAAPQWRYYGAHPHLLTNHRVCSFLDNRWEDLPLAAVEVVPDLGKKTAKRHFGTGTVDLHPRVGGEPLRLAGLGVFWWAVALRYLCHGRAGLDHPGLQRLARG
ncbi:hypothetical protein FHX42_005211 [Saccharopolyspora lacisalsi]|uniref:Uncharacterized protein n=1 Tax=Halosaccharopolyspora lacisalsi TaxID=1000566 RepID=A0A839E1T7_9PSEU|nr:hypothetical protein [Halosaccharopolyspora lacisalsi]MBA8827804.1 hypothetical protein [Halosaccharopolyspora lacisalsi]